MLIASSSITAIVATETSRHALVKTTARCGMPHCACSKPAAIWAIPAPFNFPDGRMVTVFYARQSRASRWLPYGHDRMAKLPQEEQKTNDKCVKPKRE